MIEEILQKKKKKHVQDLNIVPILDMLTTVIFFLLMSTTFIEYTKLTLPPAGTVTAADEKTIPLAPRLVLRANGANSYISTLSWGGKSPGREQLKTDDENLAKDVLKLTSNFSRKYPSEKTLQVSLQQALPYQALISVMDGSRESFPDIVMVSYHMADQP